MYTVIQWKTATSVLQSGNWVHRTVEVKVHTIQKTMIPVLSHITSLSIPTSGNSFASQYDTPPLRDVNEVRQASTNYVRH